MNLSNPVSAVEWMLGRRFEFVGTAAPDVTVVSGDVRRGTVRLHAEDGNRAHVALRLVIEAIQAGGLIESAGAPFVLDRLPAERFRRLRRTGLRTGIAGTGKRLLEWTSGGWKAV